jgi:hypothetical protein
MIHQSSGLVALKELQATVIGDQTVRSCPIFKYVTPLRLTNTQITGMWVYNNNDVLSSMDGKAVGFLQNPFILLSKALGAMIDC